MAGDTTIPIQFDVLAPQLELIERFQRENGLASRQDAVVLLLDIALEAVTGKGRRFWDRPLTDAGGAPVDQARALADRLRAEGHHAAAEQMQHATVGSRIGDAVLGGLREACQTVLTTIEALDPKTALMAEELRLEIDKLLARHGAPRSHGV